MSRDDVDCDADPALRPDDRLESNQFTQTYVTDQVLYSQKPKRVDL